jgi:spore germination protein KC
VKKLIIVLFLLGMLMTAGCWDWRIVDELAIIFGIAVDVPKEDDLFQLTFVYPIFAQEAEEAKVSTTIQGYSLQQALINLQHQSEQRPVLGRVNVFIFSEEAAQSGHMHQILRQYDQIRDNNPNAYICVVRGSTAQEVLNLELPQQPRVAVFLGNMFMDNNKEGRLPAIFATTYWTQYHTAGVSPVLPVIELVGPEGEKNGVRLEGLAVIDAKGVMKGYLSDTETIMYMLLTGNIQRGQLYTQVDVQDEEKKNVTAFIQDSSVKIKSKIIDDRIVLHLQAVIDLDGVSIDLDEGTVLKAGVVQDLEMALARDIQGNMRRVLRKTQNWEADIVGLGQFARSQQAPWFKGKEWEKEFGKSDIQVEVKVRVKRMGTLIDPTY